MAHAQHSVTLAWDRSASTTVVGYKVYYGARAGNYTNSLDMGNVLSGAVSNLKAGITYYFAATAYDSARVESDFSNEVSWMKQPATNTAPTITRIANQTINVNKSTAALGFSVKDGETPAAELQVRARSSNTSLVPSTAFSFSGSGTNRTLTVKPAANQVGTATITLTVSDGALSASTSFTLKVNPLPTIVLNSPRSGSGFVSPAEINMTASVVTNGNTINRVRFYNGTTLLASDSSPPYRFTWKNVSTGTYRLSAKVLYNGTSVVSSPQASVAVTNPPGIHLASTSGTLTHPFQISGGLISQAVTTGVADGGRAVFSFQVPVTTNYIISADVLASSGSANSFFINVDGEPRDPLMIWDIPVSSVLTKRRTSWRGNGSDTANQFSPKIFSLPAGAHQLIVRGREANTKLGQLSLLPVSGLVAPWRVGLIGSHVTRGVGSTSGGEHSILGAGTISGSGDRFSFLYQALSGDGEIKAKFKSMNTTHWGARTGVMIRESLTAGSKYVMMSKAGNGTLRWQKREATGNGTVNVQKTSSHLWLRLLRRGHKLTGYSSADGSTWSTVGVSTNVMAPNIYIGVAFASGVTNQLRSCVLTGLQVVP